MTGGHHFISYSAVDGKRHALWLSDALSTGNPSFEVWIDKGRDEDRLVAGYKFTDQIVEALRRAETVLFVMTVDSVDSHSFCDLELSKAFSYKKTIIPLLFQQEVEIPLLLGNREYIDFTGDAALAVEKVRARLQWEQSPAGLHQNLRYRLGDAQRNLRRARSDQTQVRIRNEIAQLEADMEQLECTLGDPRGTRESVAKDIDHRIEIELEHTSTPSHPVQSRVTFVNPPPGEVPPYYQDRFIEIGQLMEFLRDDTRRIATVMGRGGIGKTAMVCRLLKSLQSREPCDDLEPLSVHGVVCLGVRGAVYRISTAGIFRGLCKLLPVQESARLDALYREKEVTTEGKVTELLDLYQERSCVVLLDNLEDLIDAKTQRLMDDELRDALTTLLRAPHHGVKIIITTQVTPLDIVLVEPGRHRRIDLNEGLAEPYAKEILRAMDMDGNAGLRDAPDHLLAEAREFTRGYPRALEALFAILSADHDTSLADILRDASLDQMSRNAPPDLPEHMVNVLVGEAFSRLEPMAQQAMQALAIFGRPVPVVAVDYLLSPLVPAVDSAPRLKRLVNMHLVRKVEDRYYLHQIDRQYALDRIPRGTPGERASRPGAITQSSLRNRAADYFVRTRKDPKDWNCIEDLEAQFGEFDMRYENADYRAASAVAQRIDFDYLMMWGEYGRVLELHERLLPYLSDPKLRVHSLGSIGLALESQGKYEEAMKRYDDAITTAREDRNIRSEAANANNKAICLARLGEADQAIACHNRALKSLRHNHIVWELVRRIFGYPMPSVGHLSNLALRQADKGDREQALSFVTEALRVARRVRHSREREYMLAVILETFGQILVEMNRIEEACQKYREALVIADSINCLQVQSFSHYGLATASVLAGQFDFAKSEAQQALRYDVPDNNHRVALLLGVIQGRQGDLVDSRETLEVALGHCEKMIVLTRENYRVMDTKGVALTALASWFGDGKERTKYIEDAVGAFRAARQINREPGVTSRVVHLIDAITGDERIIELARRAAAGV